MDVGWWWKGDEWRTMCEKEQLMPKEDTAQPLDQGELRFLFRDYSFDLKTTFQLGYDSFSDVPES